MSKLARLSHIGAAKEVTSGTPVAPTFFLPVRSVSPEDLIPPIRDESLRANSSVLQGEYAGAAESKFDVGGMPHPDTFGHLLAAMGLVDTAAAVGTTGKTSHTMKATAAQPPTYTLTDFDSVQARAYPGCMLSELSLKIDPKGEVTYDAKFKGWNSAPAATPVPSFTGLQPFLGWQLTWTAGGAASTRVTSAELMFKREVDVIHASDGTQGPRETFGGGIEFTAKTKVLFEDSVELDRFLAYTDHGITATLTQPAALGDAVLVVTATKVRCNKAASDRSEKYTTLDLEFDGVFSAADGGPAFATLTNAVVAAY